MGSPRFRSQQTTHSPIGGDTHFPAIEAVLPVRDHKSLSPLFDDFYRSQPSAREDAADGYPLSPLTRLKRSAWTAICQSRTISSGGSSFFTVPVKMPTLTIQDLLDLLAS